MTAADANAKSVVMFIDLQEGLLEASRTLASSDIRRNAAALLSIARAFGLVCVASVIPTGPVPAPLIVELDRADPAIGLRPRRVISAFRSIGEPCEHLVIGGVVTEAAILHTALDAKRAGYDVDVLLDVCGGLSTRTENAAIRQMEAVGIRTSSIASFATGRLGDMANPSAMVIMRKLSEML